MLESGEEQGPVGRKAKAMAQVEMKFDALNKFRLVLGRMRRNLAEEDSGFEQFWAL